MTEQHKTEAEEIQEEIHELGLDDGRMHPTGLVSETVLKVAVLILTLSLLFGLILMIF